MEIGALHLSAYPEVKNRTFTFVHDLTPTLAATQAFVSTSNATSGIPPKAFNVLSGLWVVENITYGFDSLGGGQPDINRIDTGIWVLDQNIISNQIDSQGSNGANTLAIGTVLNFQNKTLAAWLASSCLVTLNKAAPAAVEINVFITINLRKL